MQVAADAPAPGSGASPLHVAAGSGSSEAPVAHLSQFCAFVSLPSKGCFNLLSGFLGTDGSIQYPAKTLIATENVHPEAADACDGHIYLLGSFPGRLSPGCWRRASGPGFRV